MPNQLTPEATGMVHARNRGAQVMALKLGQTGSGRYTPEVEEFQMVWNDARLITREQLQIIGLSLTQAQAVTVKLDEDGQFGRSTSGALYAIVGDPRPPTRASGMPAWVAANQSLIASLVPPTNPPVSELIDPWADDLIDPWVDDPGIDQVQSGSGGQIVVDMIDGATVVGPGEAPPIALDAVCYPEDQLPPGCSWDGSGGFRCGSNVTQQQLYDSGCVTGAEYDRRVAAAQQPGTMPVYDPTPSPIDVPILPEVDVDSVIPVIDTELLDPMSQPSDYVAFDHVLPTARPQTKVPGIAVIIGVGVLGGAFWYMRKGRKRQRVAA